MIVSKCHKRIDLTSVCIYPNTGITQSAASAVRWMNYSEFTVCNDFPEWKCQSVFWSAGHAVCTLLIQPTSTEVKYVDFSEDHFPVKSTARQQRFSKLSETLLKLASGLQTSIRTVPGFTGTTPHGNCMQNQYTTICTWMLYMYLCAVLCWAQPLAGNGHLENVY